MGYILGLKLTYDQKDGLTINAIGLRYVYDKVYKCIIRKESGKVYDNFKPFENIQKAYKRDEKDRVPK